MISKHFGDLDICVPERSEDVGAAACFGGSVCWLLMLQCQVPMNTRKQVPKLGLDLCQRTDQTLHAPGLTVVRPVGSSQRRLRMFEAVGCTYLSAMGCIGVCPGFVRQYIFNIGLDSIFAVDASTASLLRRSAGSPCVLEYVFMLRLVGVIARSVYGGSPWLLSWTPFSRAVESALKRP